MKKITKLLLSMAVIILAFTACQKEAALPYYEAGNSPILTSNVSTTNPVPADSLKNVLALSWTNPQYANDSTTSKYIIEFDSSGRNFAKEQTLTVIGNRTDTLNARALNNILIALGFNFNVTYKVDVRVTSSYGNNNVQFKSNVLTLQMTPYVVPPKVTPPSTKALYLVGSATAGSWGNPVPVPAQQFTKIDSVTYQGTFFLNGGQQYLLLPLNGDWTHKFAVQDNSITGLSAGGSFGADFPQNFPGPTATGMYKIYVDFQHGTFKVTNVSLYGLLWVAGDYQGWNPGIAPQLGSPKNDNAYEGYINITTTGGFKFTSQGDWNGTNYGDPGSNGQSGVLSTSGNNLNIPLAGYYKINANTKANTWSATAIKSWGIIGSFAPSNWGTETPMTFNASANTWTGTITTVAGDQFKFRANNDPNWTINLGETNGTGSLSYGGDNIGDASKNFAIAPGTHKITLFMGNPGYYTYMIQ